MSMIIPPAVVDAIPVRVRQGVYATLAVAFVVLTAVHAAYDSVGQPDPRALTIAFAVYGVLTSAALTLATANSRPALTLKTGQLEAGQLEVDQLEAEPAAAKTTAGPTGSTSRGPRAARRRRPVVRTPEDQA
jgi:hypothetical protein